MQRKFQSAKRLISTCLVTLLLVTSALFSFPSAAKADTDFVIVKCQSDCGNMAAFAAGAVSGSVVTLVATGNGGGVAAAGMSLIGNTAMAAAASATVPVVTAAAPVIVPVATTAAIGYGAYRLWEDYHSNQTQQTK